MKQSFFCFYLLILSVTTLKAQLNFEGFLPYNDDLNDIWGYVDNAGNEYALVGVQTGTSIVDVTTANNPTELFFIPGSFSIWRDIKTWGTYAYVTNETGGGLLIIDLSDLPNSINYQRFSNFTGSLNFQTAHNLFIDEFGIAYLFGSNLFAGGADFLNLNTGNPFEPEYLGSYRTEYIHDGYVRSNIMYGGEINAGQFSIVDVSDKQNPVIYSQHRTTFNYSHQVWLSDNDSFLVNLDELPAANVDIYSVIDPFNVELLDTYRSSPKDSVIPHNAFFLGDYIFISYYKDGVILLDASKPDNLVEVGRFDTSPLPSGPGFNGCWGVYPYLPSGNIIATDIEEGLFVLTVNYKKAGYIEGLISDSLTNQPISNAEIEIIENQFIETSNLSGIYKTGYADSGTVTLRITAPDCQTVIIPGVPVIPGSITPLNVKLFCTPNSIQTNTLNQISVFPNPVNKRLNIQANNALSALKMFNASGKVLLHIKDINHHSAAINFHTFPKGVYYLHITENEQLTIKKVLKIE